MCLEQEKSFAMASLAAEILNVLLKEEKEPGRTKDFGVVQVECCFSVTLQM